MLKTEPTLCKGIADSRVDWHRRVNWVIPQHVKVSENQQGFSIEFSLSTGVFATSLLRELIEIKNKV